MLLRRVMEHVNAQNWTAVGLDFIIVVMGVFMGIQVVNLNQSRIDRLDEKSYLLRLHNDLVSGDELTSRLRYRRIEQLEGYKRVSQALFAQVIPDEIDIPFCVAAVSSAGATIAAVDLPSLDELLSAGRIDILRDIKLRDALLELRQRTYAIKIYADSMYVRQVDLGRKYPQLFPANLYFDPNGGEARFRPECDLETMKANQEYLSDFARNVDVYDAFVRDALAPWSEQFDTVHTIIDELLSTTHSHEIS